MLQIKFILIECVSYRSVAKLHFQPQEINIKRSLSFLHIKESNSFNLSLAGRRYERWQIHYSNRCGVEQMLCGTQVGRGDLNQYLINSALFKQHDPLSDDLAFHMLATRSFPRTGLTARPKYQPVSSALRCPDSDEFSVCRPSTSICIKHLKKPDHNKFKHNFRSIVK